MSENTAPPSRKKDYNFGRIEKIKIEASSELELTVFGLMHGVDGCDPLISGSCSPQ